MTVPSDASDSCVLLPCHAPVVAEQAECAGLKAPTGAVAEAVELIKSMLLAAERAGESPAGQRAALLGRFTEDQLASAYAFLVAQGQVYSGGISKAYALSDAFKASLQVGSCIYAAV